MLVAKLPGSTNATAATNAGPINRSTRIRRLGSIPPAIPARSDSLSAPDPIGRRVASGRFMSARPMSGHEDRAPAYLAVVEVVEGLLEVGERVGGGVQGDLPAGGQHHQLGEVVVAAHQVADEVDLGRDDVDGGYVDRAAVPDDVVVAVTAQA